jgi:hypothetical protein
MPIVRAYRNRLWCEAGLKFLSVRCLGLLPDGSNDLLWSVFFLFDFPFLHLFLLRLLELLQNQFFPLFLFLQLFASVLLLIFVAVRFQLPVYVLRRWHQAGIGEV